MCSFTRASKNTFYNTTHIWKSAVMFTWMLVPSTSNHSLFCHTENTFPKAIIWEGGINILLNIVLCMGTINCSTNKMSSSLPTSISTAMAVPTFQVHEHMGERTHYLNTLPKSMHGDDISGDEGILRWADGRNWIASYLNWNFWNYTITSGNCWDSTLHTIHHNIFLLHFSTFIIDNHPTLHIANSLELSPLWEANIHLARQEILRLSWNPNVHCCDSSGSHGTLPPSDMVFVYWCFRRLYCFYLPGWRVCWASKQQPPHYMAYIPENCVLHSSLHS